MTVQFASGLLKRLSAIYVRMEKSLCSIFLVWGLQRRKKACLSVLMNQRRLLVWKGALSGMAESVTGKSELTVATELTARKSKELSGQQS